MVTRLIGSKNLITLKERKNIVKNKKLTYEEESILIHQLYDMIKEFPHLDTCSKPNYTNIPVSCLQVNEDNVNWFSDVWELI